MADWTLFAGGQVAGSEGEEHPGLGIGSRGYRLATRRMLLIVTTRPGSSSREDFFIEIV
jgi:hypothetical protein